MPKKTIKTLYISKETKDKSGLILSEEIFTFAKISEHIKNYFIENKCFPDEILLDIENYLEFPKLFVRPETLGNIKEGFDFWGIKIKVKK